MDRFTHYAWPFFEPRHAKLAAEAEAQAQALCMATKDFKRAYQAFVAKQKPVFKGD